MPVADHAASAERQIATYGEPLTLRKTSAGAFDSVTRAYTGESITTTPLVGFVAPFKVSDIDGVSIRRGDLEVRIASKRLVAAGVAIEVGDFIERSGTRYRVEGVDSRGAGGVPLVTIVQLRGTQ